MTAKLYYDDPYRLEFEAKVVHARESHARESHASESRGGRLEVVLDRTCFYPEGGGQPGDRGTIGSLDVVDVRKDDDEVVHVLAVPDAAGELPRAGSRVSCRVDRERRHDYMQQHTGQHIVSAALLEVGEYNTVSVHQGADYTTIEVDREEIREGDLARVEALANRIIQEDRPVTDHWVTDAEIASYPLRRPPKVSGSIRLVMIRDFDCVACGGVHATHTSAVGVVKCIGMEKIRGQMRTIWKIGDRAIADYALKHDVVSALTTSLSAQPSEIPERVEALQNQLLDGRRNASALQARIAALIAGELCGKAAESAPTAAGPVTAALENEDTDIFRAVVEQLAARPGCLFCVVNLQDDKLLWAVGSGATPGAEAPGLAFDRVRAELLPLVAGKGGGKPPVWQGVGNDPSRVNEFLEGFRKLVTG